MSNNPNNKEIIKPCGAMHAGIKEFYLIPIRDINWGFDFNTGKVDTVEIELKWEEYVTEDADFEIIEPKQIEQTANI